MLHLRLVAPASCSAEVADYLVADPRVTHVVVLPGASRDPIGDAIQCDVAREGASDVLRHLRALGLHDGGSLAIEEVDAAPSRHAWAAERAAPGSPDDGVVWDIVKERAWSDTEGSWSFYAFLTLATLIASVAVILDSSILVVGAMVVGPEFGPIVGIAAGVVLGKPQLAVRGLRLLLQGFIVAILITGIVAFIASVAGWIDPEDITAARPLTGFIWKPDRWSFVVAVLAGIAGTLSLTAGRSNALVGVFISVTTVPAAGNLALALALQVPSELTGSITQLLLNVAGMILAGAATLLIQRLSWKAIHVRRARVAQGSPRDDV
ncbi:MAG: DUF389 domain-containing protein [Actinomycetota bacterium]